MSAVRTTCPYCGVGCGLVASVGPWMVAGDKTHPANAGRLCFKGAALAQTLDHSEQLLHSTINGVRSDWNAALDLIAGRFRETIAAHGPDIGSANIDTNSRLCMASSVAGHVRAFGEDLVPGVYEDWDEADLVVLVGSNAAWCHPVLHQRLQATRAARARTSWRSTPGAPRRRT
jgi:assimilatory nitrate reductase catalytic subunit